MPDLQTMARAARAEAVRIDSDASRRLIAAYADVFRALSGELEAITDRIATARRTGEPISPSLLYREQRIQRLREQALQELTTAGSRARLIIGGAIDTARVASTESALTMVREITPPAVALASINLPTAAVGQAVAATTPGTPLANLLAAIAPAGADALERAIVTGVATSTNPRVVAAEVRRIIGGSAVRAMTISRTEIMRAHREGAIETYRASPVVKGWVWVAGLGSRTCASCWSQHGTEHPLDEPMASHPNCRCVAAPLTVSYRDLGIDLDDPRVPSGASLFDRAKPEVQRAVLGPSGYDAYRAGTVRLEDFVARRRSATWGATTSRASLTQARRNATERKAA